MSLNFDNQVLGALAKGRLTKELEDEIKPNEYAEFIAKAMMGVLQMKGNTDLVNIEIVGIRIATALNAIASFDGDTFKATLRQAWHYRIMAINGFPGSKEVIEFADFFKNTPTINDSDARAQLEVIRAHAINLLPGNSIDALVKLSATGNL